MRAFLDDPVRAARVLLASDLPPSLDLREEIVSNLPPIYRDVSIAKERRFEVGSLYCQLQYDYIPSTLPQWQREIQHCNKQFGTPNGYFCYLPAGRYRIGGWEEGAPTADHDVAAFWVARLPITVAQFARFVAEGYRDDRHWTPNGLEWRGDRNAPRYWGDLRYSGANQPVIGETWYEAPAFCHWLTEQLTTVLPVGHELRLPTEAEWEVAAAYDGSPTSRWLPWGGSELTPERAVYDAWKLDAPAPVGLCPAGAAACGALDLAGNVWEWCASYFKTYPEEAYTLQKDFTTNDWVSLRGGAYYNSTDVRCGARTLDHPVDGNNNYGFRVVVSPQLAHMS
jgi:formylglycine-generating enzyme required for sulfatase activity